MWELRELEKVKKPFYKRWWFIVIVIFFVLAGIGGLLEEEETTEQVEEVAVEQEEIEEQVDEPQEDEEESEEDVISTFEHTDFYEGEQTIEVRPGMVWSENSYFNVVYDALDEIKQTFDENEEVESILVLIIADFMDNKGNEEEGFAITYRYSRETFNELNYDNFKQMSLGEEWRILNESDGYFIHPAIRSKLKSKYTDNLR